MQLLNQRPRLGVVLRLRFFEIQFRPVVGMLRALGVIEQTFDREQLHLRELPSITTVLSGQQKAGANAGFRIY
ncbi:MAG: hypothetical protein M3Y27_27505 [Acidobacteriota bacterium]|nr:hypothetical protein [Acidobacteriota bacterium]